MGGRIISPQACLLATLNWLERKMGLIPERARIVRNNGTWLEFINLSADGDLDSGDFEPVMRSLISRREIADTEELTISDVLLIDFHATNPMPVIERLNDGRVTSISTPSPWRSLAIISTPRGIEAHDYSRVGVEWGANMVWPFSDDAVEGN